MSRPAECVSVHAWLLAVSCTGLLRRAQHSDDRTMFQNRISAHARAMRNGCSPPRRQSIQSVTACCIHVCSAQRLRTGPQLPSNGLAPTGPQRGYLGDVVLYRPLWSDRSLTRATESLGGSAGFLASLFRAWLDNPNSACEPNCQFTRSGTPIGLICLCRCECATVAHLHGADDDREDDHARSTSRHPDTMSGTCVPLFFM